ncbi:MAG TPA: TIR domain-containing protein [Chloroflexota bacterium]|nr:TIR domain-containing protein [Chloroflexota bacterium]
MTYVFISHVEEDQQITEQLATGLEANGFQTWYYERDSVPGPSYLSQVLDAIEESAAVVVIISRDSLGSWQVDKEIVQVHETGKPFIPLLKDLTHAEFRARNPEWAMAMGAATSTAIPPTGVSSLVPRIVTGLHRVGVNPADNGAVSGRAAAMTETHHPEPVPVMQPDVAPVGSDDQTVPLSSHVVGASVTTRPSAEISVPASASESVASAGPATAPPVSPKAQGLSRRLLGGIGVAALVAVIVVVALVLTMNRGSASKVLLQDSLTDPSKGVLDKSSGDPHYAIGYGPGYYFTRIVDKKWNNTAFQNLNALGTVTNTTIAVDARINGPLPGRTIDLACRDAVRGGYDSYYALNVRPAISQFELVKVAHNQTTDLAGPATSRAISSGHAWNHLVLTCNGNVITAGINGQLVTVPQTDSSFPAGKLWFGMEVDPGPDVGEADFKNLVVTQK